MGTISSLSVLLIVLPLLGGCQQPAPVIQPVPASGTVVGGGCDGCELMYAGMPDTIGSTDTSAGYTGPGQQLLVQGIVYQRDGKTPASGVIVYYWQTDYEGFYRKGKGAHPGAGRHGRLRGWIKTGPDGRYAIYTVRPAPYPAAAEPAHIHLSIKEPDISNEYYVDDLLFDDDPLLTARRRQSLKQRGGDGIMRIEKDGPLQVANHHIVLGLNVPGYPEKSKD